MLTQITITTRLIKRPRSLLFLKRHFVAMPDYPGLGLPLRHFPQNYNVYPLGAHGNCYGGDSDLLPVREVAMMAVMDKLMDKPDWHKKVFDEGIIEKWRKEALEYPDDELWKLATGGKVNTNWDRDADAELHMLLDIKPLTGIMSSESFDQVRRTPPEILKRKKKLTGHSVFESCEPKLATTKRLA